MAHKISESRLNALSDRLNRSEHHVDQTVLCSDEVELLAQSLSPSTSRSLNSLAFLCLSTFTASKARGVDSDPSEVIVSTISPYLHRVFDVSQTHTELDPSSLIPFTSLISALFPLSPTSATTLLSSIAQDQSADVTSSSQSDVVGEDVLAILLEAAELDSPLQSVFAEMLSQAAGTKSGRELVGSRAMEWLQGAASFKPNNQGRQGLNALAAVALSKLDRGEGAGGGGGSGSRNGDDLALCEKMVDFIKTLPSNTSSASSPATLPALEGLAILSSQPLVKERLARDSVFLQALLALAPVTAPKPGSLPVTPRGSMDFEPNFEAVETGLCYGMTTILVNITSKKPVLSAEDQQMAKLRAMAASGKRNPAGGAASVAGAGSEEAVQDDPLDGDVAVQERVRLVLRAGVTSALRGLARAESRLVKESLGKLCLNLVEDSLDRLSFVRDGGFKALSAIIRSLSAPPSVTTARPPTTSSAPSQTSPLAILPAAQALAKLVITTPPHLLFPPPHTATALDALSPMYQLLIHPDAKLLQQFEALMALTNLASISPAIADRIVNAAVSLPDTDTEEMFKSGTRSSEQDGKNKIRVMSRVEELLLDENKLVRRAATQLICNLVTSQAGFEEFTGEIQSRNQQSSDTAPRQSSARVSTRLHVLLIMASVDDLPTQLAAGGALAIITESANACGSLVSGKSRRAGPAQITDQKLTPGVNEEETDLDDGESRRRGDKSVWHRVMAMFEPPDHLDEDGEPIPVITTHAPDPGLLHRAAVILHNLIEYIATLEQPERQVELSRARDAGVETKLMSLLGMSLPTEILQPVVEGLKLLKKFPVA